MQEVVHSRIMWNGTIVTRAVLEILLNLRLGIIEIYILLNSKEAMWVRQLLAA